MRSAYETRLAQGSEEGLIQVGKDPRSKITDPNSVTAFYSHVNFAPVFPERHDLGFHVGNTRPLSELAKPALDIAALQHPHDLRCTELGGGAGIAIIEGIERTQEVCRNACFSNVTLCPIDPYSKPNFLVVCDSVGRTELQELATGKTLHQHNVNWSRYTANDLERLEKELRIELFTVLNEPFIRNQVAGVFPYVDLPQDQHVFFDNIGCYFYTRGPDSLQKILDATASDGMICIDNFVGLEISSEHQKRKERYDELRGVIGRNDQLVTNACSLVLVREGNELCELIKTECREENSRYQENFDLPSLLERMKQILIRRSTEK